MAALRYFFSLLMIPVSFVAAGISIAAYMAGQTNPNESTWITFIGLAMPVVLIINLVILVYWTALLSPLPTIDLTLSP